MTDLRIVHNLCSQISTEDLLKEWIQKSINPNPKYRPEIQEIFQAFENHVETSTEKSLFPYYTRKSALDEHLRKRGLQRIWTADPDDATNSFYHCLQYQDAVESGMQDSFEFTKSGGDKKRIEIANLFSEKVFGLKLNQMKDQLDNPLQFSGAWLQDIMQTKSGSDKDEEDVQDPDLVTQIVLSLVGRREKVQDKRRQTVDQWTIMNVLCTVAALAFHRHIIVYCLQEKENIVERPFVPSWNSAPKLTHYMAYTDPGHFEVVIPISNSSSAGNMIDPLQSLTIALQPATKKVAFKGKRLATTKLLEVNQKRKNPILSYITITTTIHHVNVTVMPNSFLRCNILNLRTLNQKRKNLILSYITITMLLQVIAT